MPLAGALVILPALAVTGVLDAFDQTYARARAAFYGLRSLVLCVVFAALGARATRRRPHPIEPCRCRTPVGSGPRTGGQDAAAPHGRSRRTRTRRRAVGGHGPSPRRRPQRRARRVVRRRSRARLPRRGAGPQGACRPDALVDARRGRHLGRGRQRRRALGVASIAGRVAGRRAAPGRGLGSRAGRP